MTGSPENRQSALQDASGDAALYRLAELATEFGAEHVASTTRAIAERVSEGRFYVACVGQFKRGKSTLLNALIGQALLPTGVAPVTTVPSVIRYGKSIAARARFEGAGWVDVPVNAVDQYLSEEKNPENVKRISGLEMFVPCSMLKDGMCLVDTPGLGSVFAENAAATHAFVPHIDAAIIVIGADPPLSGDELQLVETVASQVRDLLFVLNKADRVNNAERAAAIEFSRNVLGKRLKREMPKPFEVSALERLEGRGLERDWASLVAALESLTLHSRSSLVRQAAERGIRHASGQLVAILKEERESLLRPLAESEQRIAQLRKVLEEAEPALRDLFVLLTAEQQRLSQVLAERRDAFLKQTQTSAGKALSQALRSLSRSRNGPAHRRKINHMAQDIASAQLAPWLEGEARFAEAAFQKTAQRFIELGNEFLRRLRTTGIPTLEDLPEQVGSDQGLRACSHFQFHEIERVAAPASPLLFVWDLIAGLIGLRAGVVREAQEFLAQLLEVNSSRVQSDVDERLRDSRKELEAEIKSVLHEAFSVSERALARTRAAQAAGVQAVDAELARLDATEREIQSLL